MKLKAHAALTALGCTLALLAAMPTGATESEAPPCPRG